MVILWNFRKAGEKWKIKNSAIRTCKPNLTGCNLFDYMELLIQGWVTECIYQCVIRPKYLVVYR